MAVFSAILLTAAPPGLASEAGGAFVKIDGRESLLKSIELFLNRDQIKHIFLVLMPDVAEEAKRKHGAHLSFSGVKVISAGPRWVDQIFAAAEALPPDTTHAIIHDAARPVVPYTDIDALIESAEGAPAIALSTPVRSRLVELDEGEQPVACHSPTQYVHLLTPQVYSIAKLKEMTANRREAHASELKLIKGSPLNIRLGGTGDATLAKAMLNLLPKPKIKPANPFEEAQW
ncbi:MAG: 2-C-methyl-D-erythritol 4-phosphate cytidylyltransferase [Phycisphaerales bacterium]|jgi:2-C-methyl-D-erythritol 4-phosphate cytidylyltransferase|nr:2-C-methyl-D-erythritol 4-phosphate cytidylyltransferase [Phycisphaerales bacterium]